MNAQTQIAEYFNERVYQPARSLAAIVAGGNKINGIDLAAQGRGANPESLSFNWAATDREPSLVHGRYIKKEGRGVYISRAIGNLESAIDGLSNAPIGELAAIPMEHIAEVENFLVHAGQMLASYSGSRSSLMRVNAANSEGKGFKPEYAASQQALNDAKSRFAVLLSRYKVFTDSYLTSAISGSEPATSSGVTPVSVSFSRYTPYAAAAAGIIALYLLMTHAPPLATNPDLQRKIDRAQITTPSSGYVGTHGNILRLDRGESFDDLARSIGIPKDERGRWIAALERRNGLQATPQNDPYTRVDGMLLGNLHEPKQDRLIDLPHEFFSRGARQIALIAPSRW